MQISGITQEMNAFNDGIAGGSTYRVLIDLTRQMREKLGVLVRQGQTINVRQITIAISPENESGGEDQYGGAQAGGNLVWIHPTKARIAAWKAAFFHCQNLRKNAGLKGQKGYDYRVGLSDVYPTVAQNAWSSRDDVPHNLIQTESPDGDDSTGGLFNAYNHVMLARNGGGFTEQNDLSVAGVLGQPYATSDGSSGADLDFMIADTDGDFIPGVASGLYDTLPWSASFSGNNNWDLELGDQDFTGVPGHVAVFQHTFDKPAKTMCGLMGLDVYFTNIDDTVDNEEFRVYWSVECASGAKYLGRSKMSKRRGGGRR